MAGKLTEDQQETMIKVARAMCRRAYKDAGGDVINSAALKEYWQENKRHYINMSRTARKGYGVA